MIIANMKKHIFLAIIFVIAPMFGPLVGFAEPIPVPESVPPVASIGVLNGNNPANTGPAHGKIYHGPISVYATFVDENPRDYHFRIVKEGGNYWYTCDSLFAPENQGYDRCGYAYHQATYVNSSFTNALIATIDSEILGEGSFQVIFGAVDTFGNRTDINYLNDPQVLISIDNTKPLNSITSPVAGSVLSSSALINGTTSDASGIASVVISVAPYNGTSCGLYVPTTTLTNFATSSPAAFDYKWSPGISGLYCVKIVSEDTVGNVSVDSEVQNVTVVVPVTVIPPAPAIGGGGGGGGANGAPIALPSTSQPTAPVVVAKSLSSEGNKSNTSVKDSLEIVSAVALNNVSNGSFDEVGSPESVGDLQFGDYSSSTENLQDETFNNSLAASVIGAGFGEDSFWLTLLLIILAIIVLSYLYLRRRTKVK